MCTETSHMHRFLTRTRARHPSEGQKVLMLMHRRINVVQALEWGLFNKIQTKAARKWRGLEMKMWEGRKDRQTNLFHFGRHAPNFPLLSPKYSSFEKKRKISGRNLWQRFPPLGKVLPSLLSSSRLLTPSWSIYAEFSLHWAQRQRQTQPLIRCSPRKVRHSNHWRQEVRGSCFQNKSAALPSNRLTFYSLLLKEMIGMWTEGRSRCYECLVEEISRVGDQSGWQLTSPMVRRWLSSTLKWRIWGSGMG